MTEISIYHNPRCSKSRETLALLEARGLNIKVVEYLKQPPTADEITHLLSLLGLSARQLMRTKETEYKALGLDDESLTESQLIDAMVTTPKLIERPIVLANGKAAIGRPLENILAILEK
ncbi:arsenate reductase (glutaredoxin) [Shewanella sp. SR44-3]|uniref:arsenate reductase (glutaredoxin) n=1 Tax=unclassified Shewanella TaxID=196818 RepID=UPI0015F90899|nr:arsenate reductase (glutaredoxin) [Shewanella sp. SR44-3]MBB1270755.1 arsenate reductase (glutaredoxin) [Shewanella sp. SR44-3]